MKSASQPQALSKDFDFNQAVPGWSVNMEASEISRQFLFKDFGDAFEFMTLSAQYAQEINHHPDWSNSWNKVNVCLSTHSVKGLTELDVLMAQAMERFSRQVSQVA